MIDLIVSQNSHPAEVLKTPLAHPQKAGRWTYFDSNLSLTRALVNRAESSAAKVAVIAPGVVLALVEMFLLIPLKLTIANAVIWLVNQYSSASGYIFKEHVQASDRMIHSIAEDTKAPSSVKETVPVFEPASLSSPQQLGRIDIEIQHPTETTPARVIIYVYAKPEEEAESRAIVDQANYTTRMVATQLNAQSGAKPGDPNYVDPEIQKFVLKTDEKEKEGWHTLRERSEFLGAARVQMHEKVSADSSRHLIQQRLWTNPTKDNPTGEITRDEMALIFQELVNGELLKREAPSLGENVIEPSQEEQTAGNIVKPLSAIKKMSHVAAKAGMVSSTALLAFKSLEYCGYQSPWVKGGLSLLAAIPIAKEAYANSTTATAQRMAKEILAMANITGVHLVASAMSRNHPLSYALFTLPVSFALATETMIQPNVSSAAKSTGITLSSIAGGVAGYFLASSLGADSAPLKITLAGNTLTQSRMALTAPTWTDTAKSITKASLTIGVGVGVDYGLKYLGMESETSGILAAATASSLTAALYAKSWESTSKRLKDIAYGLGLGAAAHNAYSFLGISPMGQVCDQTGRLQRQQTFLNPILSSMAFSQAHMSRPGTPGEQRVEAAKEVAKSILINSAGFAGVKYVATPAIRSALSYLGYSGADCITADSLALPALIGYSIYRSLGTYSKMADQTKKAVDHVFPL